MNTSKYLFTSQRLGFRSWVESDLNALAAMNSDPEVMRHFPSTLTRKESAAMLERLQQHYHKHGFTYYAVEILESEELIGFIGLAYKDFEAEFTPAVDIGWRLKSSSWKNGYASEGALRCLEYAFSELNLKRIVSTCPKSNKASERVMQKIGMQFQAEFDHVLLQDYPELEPCVWYEITLT